MWQETIMVKILDRYGVLGAIVIMLSLMILLLVWIFLCTIEPVFIFAPVFLAWGMGIWSVTRGNDD